MGNYYCGMMFNRGYLKHYGVKGQEWGVRRYQNEDMSLTELGKKHYGSGSSDESEKGDSSAAISKIKAMYGQLKDKETSKELDYIIEKVKSGAYSEQEAMDAAKNAVELDKERVEYLAKKKEQEKKKKENEQKKKEKAAQQAASSNSSSSSTGSRSVSRAEANRILEEAMRLSRERAKQFEVDKDKRKHNIYRI